MVSRGTFYCISPWLGAYFGQCALRLPTPWVENWPSVGDARGMVSKISKWGIWLQKTVIDAELKDKAENYLFLTEIAKHVVLLRCRRWM